MAETKSKGKKREEPVRSSKRGRMTAQENASGTPSRGGSRQGNVGHESSQSSDDAHR